MGPTDWRATGNVFMLVCKSLKVGIKNGEQIRQMDKDGSCCMKNDGEEWRDEYTVFGNIDGVGMKLSDSEHWFIMQMMIRNEEKKDEGW